MRRGCDCHVCHLWHHGPVYERVRLEHSKWWSITNRAHMPWHWHSLQSHSMEVLACLGQRAAVHTGGAETPSNSAMAMQWELIHERHRGSARDCSPDAERTRRERISPLQGGPMVPESGIPHGSALPLSSWQKWGGVLLRSHRRACLEGSSGLFCASETQSLLELLARAVTTF